MSERFKQEMERKLGAPVERGSMGGIRDDTKPKPAKWSFLEWVGAFGIIAYFWSGTASTLILAFLCFILAQLQRMGTPR